MKQEIAALLTALETYYAREARHDLPWRQPEADGRFDPYKILVSEIMLQQTQVGRVIQKYQLFLELYPTIHDLANADLADVLRVWQGLGYNRRAKYLWQAAGVLHTAFANGFPQTQAQLVTLPGVGKNTAGAIMAYAFDAPVVFVETNIRTVIIHHCFADQGDVTDQEITAVLAELLAQTTLSPRHFYWACMDYGTFVKSTVGNLNKLSKSYVKQSTFHGSRRQIRGLVLRELTTGPKTLNMLSDAAAHDERLTSVIDDLLAEGMIRQSANHYTL